MNRGEGFIWYLYDNALVPESKPLPLDLVVAKNQTAGDVIVDLSTAGDGWTLIGNPFSGDLFVDNIESWNLPEGGSLQSNIAQVWDPASESYVILSGSNDQAAAMQGFFLQTDTATKINVPESATGSGAAFYKRKMNQAVAEFEVSGQGGKPGKKYTDKAFKLFFSEDSNHEWDLNDAQKLAPLTQKNFRIGFIGTSKKGKTILKAQDSHPIHFEESIAIPVDFFSYGIEGEAELSIINSLNLPESILIEIEDTKTGIRQLIDSQTPFLFKFSKDESNPFKNNKEVSVPLAAFPQVIKSPDHPRFFMHIYPNREKLEHSQIPLQFALNQNYPNPFNPTTTISYALPEPSEVHLAVYDMLGRKISELVNNSVKAGNHTLTFDASDLSSGIYIYRLRANNTVFTRKLTVIK